MALITRRNSARQMAFAATLCGRPRWAIGESHWLFNANKQNGAPPDPQTIRKLASQIVGQSNHARSPRLRRGALNFKATLSTLSIRTPHSTQQSPYGRITEENNHALESLNGYTILGRRELKRNFWVIHMLNVNLFYHNLVTHFGGKAVGMGFAICQAGKNPKMYSEGSRRRPNEPFPALFDVFAPVHISSASKTITAIGMLQILRAKNLSADTSIVPYLPHSWVIGSNVGRISFKMLLTHTSGFRSGADDSATLKTVVAAGVRFQDQGVSSYANSNFALMRILISDMGGIGGNASSGDKYVKYIQDNVFNPAISDKNIYCKPIGDNPTLYYNYGDLSVHGQQPGDLTGVAGAWGWHISILQMSGVILSLVSTENLLPQPMREQMLSEKLGCYHGDGLYYHHHNGEDGYGQGTGSGCCWVYFPATQHVVFIFMNSSPAIAGSPEVVAQAYYASWGSSRTGDPVGYTRSDNFSAVVHRANNGHLHELFLTGTGWKAGDLSVTGTPLAAGRVSVSARADGINSVVFRSASTGHIVELALTSAGWKPTDLTATWGGPSAVGDPATYVRADGFSAIVFRSAANHIIEMKLTQSGWVVGDLTAKTSTPASASDPTAYVRSDGVSSVVFRSFDNHVREIYLPAGAQDHWAGGDPSALAGAPAAMGTPFGYVRHDGTNAVVFRASDNTIHELYLTNAGWQSGDLNVPGTQPSAGSPAAYVRSDGMSAVVFRSNTNHIIEVALGSADWVAGDLTAWGGPLAASDPAPYVRADGTNVVIYRSLDNHVNELALNNGRWSAYDLTASAGETP